MMRAPLIRAPCIIMMNISAPRSVAEHARRGARADRRGSGGLCTACVGVEAPSWEELTMLLCS